MPASTPNILFIFSDQQRWDTCGCYGQPLDITPNLDRMASEGVRFENAFTCQPVCGPARAALQTGKYATEVGCHVNHRMLPLDEKTLAHYLEEQGYDTAYIGKWHLASFGDNFPQGRYRVDAQTDWVLEYLRSCHDGCIRIPMILHGPGFTGGKVVADELVSLIDLPPTILNAAAPPADQRLCPQRIMRGRPLQELAAGNALDWPGEVFLQISESQCGRAIRTKKWKYSVRAPDKTGLDPSSDVYLEDFLYDLEADPHERNNRVADPELAMVRETLRETLRRRMKEAGEAEPEIRPAVSD